MVNSAVSDDGVLFVRCWHDDDVVDGANAELLLKGREAAAAAAQDR